MSAYWSWDRRRSTVGTWICSAAGNRSFRSTACRSSSDTTDNGWPEKEFFLKFQIIFAINRIRISNRRGRSSTRKKRQKDQTKSADHYHGADGVGLCLQRFELAVVAAQVRHFAVCKEQNETKITHYSADSRDKHPGLGSVGHGSKFWQSPHAQLAPPPPEDANWDMDKICHKILFLYKSKFWKFMMWYDKRNFIFEFWTW